MCKSQPGHRQTRHTAPGSHTRRCVGCVRGVRDVSIQVSDLNHPAGAHGVRGNRINFLGGFGSSSPDRVTFNNNSLRFDGVNKIDLLELYGAHTHRMIRSCVCVGRSGSRLFHVAFRLHHARRTVTAEE